MGKSIDCFTAVPDADCRLHSWVKALSGVCRWPLWNKLWIHEAQEPSHWYTAMLILFLFLPWSHTSFHFYSFHPSTFPLLSSLLPLLLTCPFPFSPPSFPQFILPLSLLHPLLSILFSVPFFLFTPPSLLSPIFLSSRPFLSYLPFSPPPPFSLIFLSPPPSLPFSPFFILLPSILFILSFPSFSSQRKLFDSCSQCHGIVCLPDFFRGSDVSKIRLAGLDHVICCTAVERKIHFRTYQ